MAALNLKAIKSAAQLELRACRDLQGKTLKQIAKDIHLSDDISRVLSKASVGYVIEEGYFGIKKNSGSGPDIPHLGVEVKTSPLKMGKDGKLRVKEPLSLNIINYVKEFQHKTIRTSSLYKKNRKILFVWYIHDKGKPRSQYLIKYVFLWEMDRAVVAELEPDYKAIIKKIGQGRAHHIHQYDHKALTLCPKHGGTFKNPRDTKSKTKQPFSKAPAEVRAFRLKNSYMNNVIWRYLLKKGWARANEFAEPKPVR